MAKGDSMLIVDEPVSSELLKQEFSAFIIPSHLGQDLSQVFLRSNAGPALERSEDRPGLQLEPSMLFGQLAPETLLKPVRFIIEAG